MRCYNGCPDSQLKALLDSKAAAKARLKAAFPTASCTYFPEEEAYLAFKDYKQVGTFQDDVIVACDEAIRILNEELDKRVFEFVEQLVKNRRSPNEWIALLRNGSNIGEDRTFTENEANVLLMRYLLNPNASYSPKSGEAWKANCGV